MDRFEEKVFDDFCKATVVRDDQIGLVRHGWIGALNRHSDIVTKKELLTLSCQMASGMFSNPACREVIFDQRLIKERVLHCMDVITEICDEIWGIEVE